MKKWALYFLAAVICVGITACNKDDGNNDSGGTTAVTPTNNNCSLYTRRSDGRYQDANGRIVSCRNNGIYNGNSCINYRWDPVDQRYEDNKGRKVNCDRNGIFTNGVYPGGQGGCEIYNYRGRYFPVLMYGTIVCVGYDHFMSQGLNPYLFYNNSHIGGNYLLQSCRVGVGQCNCDSALGGTLQWCFYH